MFGGRFGQPSPPPEPQPEKPPPDFNVKPSLLGDALEELILQVWESEDRERMNDRIDAAIRNDEERERQRSRAKPKR